jgi:hypothetical protein
MKEKMVLIALPGVNTPYKNKDGEFSFEENDNNPDFIGRLTIVNNKISVGILKSTPLVDGAEKETVEYMKKYFKMFSDPKETINFVSFYNVDKVQKQIDNFNPEKWLSLLPDLFPNLSTYEERETDEFPIYETNSFLASVKK